jgi:hypothetical protein
MPVWMFFAPFVIVALLVAVVALPAFQRLQARSTPYAKQRRRMEQARAEYRRSVELERSR